MKMKLEKWEKDAFKYLTKLYQNFFRELSRKGMECFRIDAKKFFSNNVQELTVEQEKKIYDFWNRYTQDFDITYHKYYIDRTGSFDVRFVPDDLFVMYIDGYLNNRAIEPGIADKNYFDLYLKGFKMPKTYIHLINGIFEDDNYNIVTKDRAVEILAHKSNITVKPSMASYGGKGLTFLDNPSKKEILEILDSSHCENLIFQETVSQSKITAQLHPKSLNTIRIMTLLWHEDVHVLHSVFRMGIGDSRVDNASAGGIYCKIDEKGSLSPWAYDALGHKYDNHPDGGNFSDISFDFMDSVKELVKSAAKRFPHFKLIGWDIAIDKNYEPVIIEANLTMSGMDVIETICGPLFGEYTEEVLHEVFCRKNKEKQSLDILQYI